MKMSLKKIETARRNEGRMGGGGDQLFKHNNLLENAELQDTVRERGRWHYFFSKMKNFIFVQNSKPQNGMRERSHSVVFFNDENSI